MDQRGHRVVSLLLEPVSYALLERRKQLHGHVVMQLKRCIEPRWTIISPKTFLAAATR